MDTALNCVPRDDAGVLGPLPQGRDREGNTPITFPNITIRGVSRLVEARAPLLTIRGVSRLVEARAGLVEDRAKPGWSRRDMSELVEVRPEVTRTNDRRGDSLKLSAWAQWP